VVSNLAEVHVVLGVAQAAPPTLLDQEEEMNLLLLWFRWWEALFDLRLVRAS